MARRIIGAEKVIAAQRGRRRTGVSQCAGAVVRLEGKRGVRLTLMLSHFENWPHLNVIELRPAA